MNSLPARYGLTYAAGFIGTQGTGPERVSAALGFAALGIEWIDFVQFDAAGNLRIGGDSGTDLSGTLRLRTAAARTVELRGELRWRIGSTDRLDALGFVLAADQCALIGKDPGSPYRIVGGTIPNVSATIGLRAFQSRRTFEDGRNYLGQFASPRVLLDALEAERVLLATVDRFLSHAWKRPLGIRSGRPE